jgi:hypothetical protein
LENKGNKSREDAWVNKENVIERKFNADSGLSRVVDYFSHCGNFVVLVESNHSLGTSFFKILICCLLILKI